MGSERSAGAVPAEVLCSGRVPPRRCYCGGAWVCVVVVVLDAPGAIGMPVLGSAGPVVVVVVRSVVVVTGGGPPHALSSAAPPSSVTLNTKRRQVSGEIMIVSSVSAYCGPLDVVCVVVVVVTGGGGGTAGTVVVMVRLSSATPLEFR